ncbi:unnamed protein product, partial [Adineta steineri]
HTGHHHHSQAAHHHTIYNPESAYAYTVPANQFVTLPTLAGQAMLPAAMAGGQGGPPLIQPNPINAPVQPGVRPLNGPGIGAQPGMPGRNPYGPNGPGGFGGPGGIGGPRGSGGPFGPGQNGRFPPGRYRRVIARRR